VARTVVNNPSSSTTMLADVRAGRTSALAAPMPAEKAMTTPRIAQAMVFLKDMVLLLSLNAELEGENRPRTPHWFLVSEFEICVCARCYRSAL